MTKFKFGDVVKCTSALSASGRVLNLNALYVVESVAVHGASIKVAGEWHSINRFEKIGTSTVSDPDGMLFKKMNVQFDLLEMARRGVLSAFDWDHSEEGDTYWLEVHEKLDAYCDRFRPFVNDVNKAA